MFVYVGFREHLPVSTSHQKPLKANAKITRANKRFLQKYKTCSRSIRFKSRVLMRYPVSLNCFFFLQISQRNDLFYSLHFFSVIKLVILHRYKLYEQHRLSPLSTCWKLCKGNTSAHGPGDKWLITSAAAGRVRTCTTGPYFLYLFLYLALFGQVFVAILLNDHLQIGVKGQTRRTKRRRGFGRCIWRKRP